jgi:hypothetical protein
MTPGYLDYFAPFLLPDGGLVAVFAGYFDESERLDGHEPICLAGFIFTPAQYKQFRLYWQRNVLRYRGRKFSAFHTTDLVSGHQEYEGLGIPDRLQILDHAIHAIAKNATAGIAVHFSQSEFARKAPANWANTFGSIYTVACSMCLQTTGFWLTELKRQMDVLYVFEAGHKFRAEADEFLAAMGENVEMRQRSRYSNHIFQPKSEPGLQAADFFAWTVTRVMTINDPSCIPRSLRPFVEPIRRLAAASADRFKFYAFTGLRLERFFDDVAAQQLQSFTRRTTRVRGLR